ncbi:MAG: allophanate hydrolase subunit 1 [Proteobacteria bacterium]|nr:allophanate hydrolase subunit 1 [Pseudomonadota bacterium]
MPPEINRKKYHLGDSCLCWSLGDVISNELSELILTIYGVVREKQQTGMLSFLDVVPSYNALAVHYDPVDSSLTDLEAKIDGIVDQVLAEGVGNKPAQVATHKLPTTYDGDDLTIVAEKNELTVEQVIELHQKVHYKVAMVGFLPHFPYLIGLDPKLETPRLDSPRTKIPAGAVAIGGAQTGVYPSESPGGWNIIGLTRPTLLEPINPGDIVIFEKVETL